MLFVLSCNSDKTIELDEQQVENSLHSEDFFSKSTIKASLVDESSNEQSIDPVFTEMKQINEEPTEQVVSNPKVSTVSDESKTKPLSNHVTEIKQKNTSPKPIKRPKKELKSAKTYVKNNAVASDKEIVNNHLEKIIRMVYTDRYQSPNLKLNSSLNNNDIIYVDLTWADNWNNTYKMGGKLSVRSNNTLYFEINERNMNVEALEFTEDNYKNSSIIGSI